jgi:hypothetical protein
VILVLFQGFASASSGRAKKIITADGCELGGDGWSLVWCGAGHLPVVKGDYQVMRRLLQV